MLLGFKKRFVEPIQIGTKVLTMRSHRKVQPKIGETLYMYTGLRTPNCQIITNKEKLMSTQNAYIEIVREVIEYKYFKGVFAVSYKVIIIIDHRYLSNDEIKQFVKYDGFINTTDFALYWIESKYAPKQPPKDISITVSAHLQLFHWTDLRY